MQWFDPIIMIYVGMSLFLHSLVAYLWHKKFYRKLGIKTYRAIQRIHLNETPRLGGLIFILSLTSFVVLSNSNESIQLLKIILICLIPIIIVGIKEDLFHNVEPVTRLLALLFVGWLFVVKFTGPLPVLTNIPFIGKLLLLPGGLSFFYILSMAGIANGMNMIDGVNGLCGAVTLTILSTLLFLSYKTSDITMLSLIFIMILFFIPFMLMNYPYGRIFLGDLGAYSLGLILSMVTIIFFGRHPEISPWVGALVLIYPAIEVIFSLLRRIIFGTSVFKPDLRHLHLEIYNFFRSQIYYKKLANSLVMPVLSSLWLFPLIASIFAYTKPVFVLISIMLFLAFYLLIYFAILKIDVKK